MVVTGTLCLFTDQGMEGDCFWVVYRDGMRGFDALFEMRTTDRLIVFEDDGKILFDGPSPGSFQAPGEQCLAWARSVLGERDFRDYQKLRVELHRNEISA